MLHDVTFTTNYHNNKQQMLTTEKLQPVNVWEIYLKSV